MKSSYSLLRLDMRQKNLTDQKPSRNSQAKGSTYSMKIRVHYVLPEIGRKEQWILEQIMQHL